MAVAALPAMTNPEHPTAPPSVVPLLDRLLGPAGQNPDFSARAYFSGLRSLASIICAELPPTELKERFGPLADRWQAKQRKRAISSLLLEAELSKLLRAIKAEGIDLLLMKGADLAYTLYPQPGMRPMNDLDLMIHETDVATVGHLLERLGYAFYQEHRVASIQTRHVSFHYRRPGHPQQIDVEIHTAPHFTDLPVQFDVAGYWARARQVTVRGVDVKAMSLEDIVLYTAWHFRSHAFAQLIWLYDIALILATRSTELDWPRLLAAAKWSGLRTTLYYSLRWAQLLFQVPVPIWVIRDLRPPRIVRFLVDQVVLQHHLDVLLATESGYTRRTAVQRLMVDSWGSMAIMLARLLFPSRTTLGGLYLSDPPRPLWWVYAFYLVHPIRMIGWAVRAAVLWLQKKMSA